MRKYLLIAILMIATPAMAQVDRPDGGGSGGPAPGTQPTTAKAPAISDYNKGWCTGWAISATLQANNYQSMVKFMGMVNPKLKDDKSPVGDAVRTIMDTMAKSVLVPPQPGKVTLGDGTVIDCLGVSTENPTK